MTLQLRLKRKPGFLILVLAALMVSALFANYGFGARAATRGSTDDAIAIAAAHPAFAAVLTANPGYTAAAYDTGLSYGIWRVQFWDAEGEEIGWANVSVSKGRVYSWENTWGLTEEQRWTREDDLLEVLANDADVVELVGDPRDRDIWIDYNGWLQTWYVYIEAGKDSLYVGVKVDSVDPLEFENPHVTMIYFSNVKEYDEWEQDQQAQVIALAFAKPEIAGAVRDHDGWYTETERTGDTTWLVRFKAGEQVLATATVDVEAQEVIDFSIEL